MDTLDEVAIYFEGEIERIVQAEEQQLRDEIEELRMTTKRKIEATASQSVVQYRKQKEEDLQREIALSKSTIKQKFYKELSDKRNGIGEDVFADVVSQINEFTKSDEYKTNMIAAIDAIDAKDVTLYVREEDQSFLSKFDTTTEPTIKLGGFIVKHNNSNRLEDKTIDTKFENQKTWFYENSGLEQI